jgi:hypothetical protein
VPPTALASTHDKMTLFLIIVIVWATIALQINSILTQCYGPTTVMIIAAMYAEVEEYCILMIVMT